MYFFDTVQTFATMGKSDKGKALQEIAKRFEHVLVQGEEAIVKISIALLEQVQLIDKRYPRGRQTYVDWDANDYSSSGYITIMPTSEAVRFDIQPYVRMHFCKVARTATIQEAVALAEEGGEA